MDLSTPVSRSNFRFRLARFWGSPDLVPGINIIANVLAKPCQEDLDQVVAYFGRDSVRQVLSMLIEDKEISDAALVIVKRELEWL